MFRNPYADGLIVLLILLLFFGPKRLPLLGRNLGEGMREFKDSITGNSKSDDDEQPPALSAAAAAPPAPAQPAAAQPASAATAPERESVQGASEQRS
jgi:sec-independent protein translocase protein TatA